MYNYKINNRHLWVYLISKAVFFLIVVICFILMFAFAFACKKELNATNMKFQIVNVEEKYTNKSFTERIDGAYKSFFSFYDEDGNDAIKTNSDMANYLALNQRTNNITTAILLLSALEIIIAVFVIVLCLVGHNKLWFIIPDLFACLLLFLVYSSGDYIQFLIGIIIMILTVPFSIMELKRINNENYKIANRKNDF